MNKQDLFNLIDEKAEADGNKAIIKDAVEDCSARLGAVGRQAIDCIIVGAGHAGMIAKTALELQLKNNTGAIIVVDMKDAKSIDQITTMKDRVDVSELIAAFTLPVRELSIDYGMSNRAKRRLAARKSKKKK